MLSQVELVKEDAVGIALSGEHLGQDGSFCPSLLDVSGTRSRSVMVGAMSMVETMPSTRPGGMRGPWTISGTCSVAV